MEPHAGPLFGVRGLHFFRAAVLIASMLGALPAAGQEDLAPAGSAATPGSGGVASLYEDFVHFARLGRFDAAGAYAARLLEHPDLDPVALLEVAERNQRSVDTLIMLIKQSPVAEKARQVLDVIRRGEHERRRDPGRIKDNIKKLSGPPQTEYNAIQRLRESGEHAIPWMVDTLTRPEFANLRPRIIRALPQIGKGAVSPLVAALDVENDGLRETVARALGEIGYPQAIPYLQKLLAREGIADEVRQSAVGAIAAIERRAGRPFVASPSAGFFQLAEQYYCEHGSVKADARLDRANLWSVRDGFLTAVAVPTEIHGPVMAMRCCEEAIALEPSRTDAIALWLAANIRREARLGMDVESGHEDDKVGNDPSTPADFPRSIYFTRAAGPLFAHLALERAVRDGDSAVALGAIAALRVTAGEPALVGAENYKQPLVQALRFPDRLVRIKAALAIAEALPKSPFVGSDVVPRVLADSLTQIGAPHYVVIDPDQANLNRVLGELRAQGATALGEVDFLAALERVRSGSDSVSCFFVATDVAGAEPLRVIHQLRQDLAFATTPVVLLTKPDQASVAEEIARAVPAVARVDSGATANELDRARDGALAESGQTPLGPEAALQMALQTADVLRRVALDGRTVIPWQQTETALIAALNGKSEELRTKAASVLACVSSSGAQRSLAQAALDGANGETLRIVLFGSLAESARRNGNRLDSPLVDELVSVAADEPVLSLRTAASQALGALNLTDSKASEIIRKHTRR